MKQIDLIRVVEECGEVIQAATKIMRFGLVGSYDDGRSNITVLTTEVGDLLACIDRLDLDHAELIKAKIAKQNKIRQLEQYELGFDCVLTREQREDLHKTGAKR